MPSKRSLALNRRKLLTLSALSISSSIAGCATLRARLEAFGLGTPERQIAADWHPSPGQWPMRGYSYARTRHNPFATPPRHNPVRAWTYAVSSSNLQSLVVSDDTVFVRSKASLTALNATDGRKQWHRSRNNSGRLIYIAGRLYDVAQDGIRAITPDGTELWSTELDREYYSLLERDGWIYLSNRNVVRLHADTGDIVSKESQDVWLPTTMGGPVYTGRFSLSAYDILDGQFVSRWSANPKGYYEPFAPAVGSDGLLYLTERAIRGVDTEPGRLSIYDATDGSKQAAITFPLTPLIPAADTDTVYVSTSALVANAIGSDGRFVASLTTDLSSGRTNRKRASNRR